MDRQVARGEGPYDFVSKTQAAQGPNLRESLETLHKVLLIICQEAEIPVPGGQPSPSGLEHTLAYCIDEAQAMGNMARDIHQYIRRIASMIQSQER